MNKISIFFSILIIFFLALILVKKLKANPIATKADEYINAWVKMKKFSGSVLIAKEGKFLLNKGYGMANYTKEISNTPTTRFPIGSVTKQFTAMGIMILQQKGLLNVDDPISTYLPDYPRGNEITIYHLLTHTSGIICDPKNFELSLQELIDTSKNMPLEFNPGEKHQYSNLGYVLLSYIIEKVSGTSYKQFFKENIFQPLEMNDTGFGYDSNNPNFAKTYLVRNGAFVDADLKLLPFLHGAGAMYSTTEDLYRWDQALYTDKLVSKDLITKTCTPFKDNYACGWVAIQSFDKKNIWHNGAIGSGGGCTSVISRFPDDNVCIILLCNLDITTAATDMMFPDLAAIIFDKPYKFPKAKVAIKVDPKLYEAYVGRYELTPDFILTITKEGNKLFTQAPKEPKLELYPESETTFFLPDFFDIRFSFIKDEKGNVISLILHELGKEFTANKIL